jgi:vitamin B12 transporter
MLDLPTEPTIVVTASRAPEAKDETPASITLIDATRIERLGAPLVIDLLRLSPSLAVSVSGPAGSLADVRIRGAEANHSLLFVEGIRANDPAAGNAPRFELLNADLASRIEIVRGPQSALWGSEAIGGVVAVEGPAAGSGGTLADVEAGSFGTRRAAARSSIGSADRGLSFGIAGQRSDGIDSFSGSGDRDGYRNLSARAAGTYRLGDKFRLKASAFASRGMSEFDGYDPTTFLRADTADRTRNRIAAARVAATYGAIDQTYATVSASLLGSGNRNLLDGEEVNRTRASRRTAAIEGGHRIGHHRFIAALESERERFHSRDSVYGGATDQDRSRAHHSLTAEWKMTDLGRLSTDLAVRRDIFSRFNDATTVRGGARLELGKGVALAANYGSGIAQPTFFDLFGFFPGSFAGNPSLRPEKSRGGEVSLRYASGPATAALTYYRQRLRGEIVDVFAFPLSTTVNGEGTSRRQGVEVEFGYTASEALRLSAAYSYLDASEPRGPDGTQLREQRRPRHGGSVALDGASGRLTYGASVAYSGAHLDTNFDVFPAQRVRLNPYWLAGARVAYRLSPAIEAHIRIANAFDDQYQDVLGYRTEGRSIHGGFRLALGR